MSPIVETKRLIPNHQFGFRQKHLTIEQYHRVVHLINTAFEDKDYCTAVFLEISQDMMAFFIEQKNQYTRDLPLP